MFDYAKFTRSASDNFGLAMTRENYDVATSFLYGEVGRDSLPVPSFRYADGSVKPVIYFRTKKAALKLRDQIIARAGNIDVWLERV